MRAHHALLITTVLALGAAPALAGGHDASSVVAHIFETADTDGNGSLSSEEYGAAGLERFGVTFEQCDADGNGETSMAEYLALYESHHGGADRVSL